MITEAFLDLFAGFIEWFLGLFGTDSPPAWLDDLAGFVTELVSRASGLGAWFPFALFGTIAATVIGLWAIFWAIKGLRWIWGLTPFSGGS